MQSILEEIVEAKRKDLEFRKRDVPLAELEKQVKQTEPPANDFLETLIQSSPHGMHIIAEIKKASPSRGIICEDFRPLEFAERYQQAGASAISVLTEERFFMGSDDFLREIASTVPIPVLRKDFIIDPYQIYETRCLGACAFLLIVDCLTADQLASYLKLGKEMGITGMVEVHREREVKIAIDSGAEIIGINNRDLRTFKTSLHTSIELRALIPAGMPVVSESGIHEPGDVKLLSEHGIQAVLIGEELMKEPANIEDKLKRMLSF
jgi:indole-3-glycerol phosphate synthase